MIQEFYPMNGGQWITAGQIAGLEKRIEELTAEVERLRTELRNIMESIDENRKNESDDFWYGYAIGLLVRLRRLLGDEDE